MLIVFKLAPQNAAAVSIQGWPRKCQMYHISSVIAGYVVKEATQPQSKHADRTTLPSSSQKVLVDVRTLRYFMGVEKQVAEKV